MKKKDPQFIEKIKNHKHLVCTLDAYATQPASQEENDDRELISIITHFIVEANVSFRKICSPTFMNLIAACI